jgi:hypothetical protein
MTMVEEICDKVRSEFPNAEPYMAHFGLYGVILPWDGKVIVVTDSMEEGGSLVVGWYTQEQWDNGASDNLGYEEVSSVARAMEWVNKWTGGDA